MRNYIDALLGTYTFVTIQTDPPPPTITGRFVAEFFAETQEELDAIAAIYASFFVNVPNNIDCQIESQFTVVAFVQLDASNVMQLLQFIHASFPSTLGLLWEAINQPREQFDQQGKLLFTVDENEIIVFDSPRKSWSGGH